jgi:hypothetical protein
MSFAWGCRLIPIPHAPPLYCYKLVDKDANKTYEFVETSKEAAEVQAENKLKQLCNRKIVAKTPKNKPKNIDMFEKLL